MPIRTNALMNANASGAAKVLPIAKTPIRKTGRLITKAQASGNRAAGRQPPRRLRNQDSKGAYAREKSSAVITSEMSVTPFALAVFKVWPSTRKNVSRRADSPSSHDPREIEISFIMIRCRVSGVGLWPVPTPDTRYLTPKVYFCFKPC